jgi:hypothetical protein
MYLPLGIPLLNSLKGKGSHSIDHSLMQLIREGNCNIEKKKRKNQMHRKRHKRPVFMYIT